MVIVLLCYSGVMQNRNKEKVAAHLYGGKEMNDTGSSALC